MRVNAQHRSIHVIALACELPLNGKICKQGVQSFQHKVHLKLQIMDTYKGGRKIKDSSSCQNERVLESIALKIW